jgi:PAS domain S-box-containing protein
MAKSYEEILAENEGLRRSLGESQEILQAISRGEVDALVLSRPEGEQVFTLEGADRAYRVLIEAMNDGAVTMTSDGTILYCNRRFADMVKSPLEKVIGSSFYRFIPQSDHAAFRVLQQGLGRDELTLKAEDESILPVYISINSLELSECQEAFCVVVTDLTEQKRKEEIVAAEKLARSIIEQATEAVIVCDENGKIIRFSNAASRTLGCDPSLQSFEDLFDLRLQNGKKLFPVSEALRGVVLLQSEVSFERSDGTLFHLLLNAGPLKGADGKIMGCVVTLTDITERKRSEIALLKSNEELEATTEKLRQQNDELTSAQSALKESECRERERAEELATFLDATPMPVFIVHDPDSTHITGNRAADDLLRNPYGAEASLSAPAATKPSHFKAVKDGRELSTDELPAQRAARGFQVKDFEFSLVFDDGTIRHVVGYGVPLRDDQGRPRGATHVLVDITERKQAEEELRKARNDLEQKVQQRTTELQSAKEEMEIANEELQMELEAHRKLEADLVKAKDAAEEAAEAKAAFLANMSHELRTPMNAVIGYTNLLLDESLTLEQKEYIEGIRNGGEALLNLINSILDFSRAEKNKLELEHMPLSLRCCVEEALDMVAVQASEKGLNLSYTINYGTPDTFIGDHGRLRQILINLLSNAVKFTDEGAVSVYVSFKAIEDNKRQLLFSVKDTGIGISQEKLSKMFEPFTQLERILSRKREGVGLGLAISKRLVELMGGTIWAESLPGQGSTFHFTIQAEAIPGRQLDLWAKKKEEALVQNLSGLEPLRILVAEDNPSNQRVLVTMLKRLGYRPDAVADGKEVLQALERQPYDLVFMDVKMPEMDGITATQVIRKLQPAEGPKIVAITAYALEGDREKCLEVGMDAYIAKPVQMRELVEILKRCSQAQ